MNIPYMWQDVTIRYLAILGLPILLGALLFVWAARFAARFVIREYFRAKREFLVVSRDDQARQLEPNLSLRQSSNRQPVGDHEVYYRLADDPKKVTQVPVEITTSESTPTRMSDSASFRLRATFSGNHLEVLYTGKTSCLDESGLGIHWPLAGTRKVGQYQTGNE